MEPSAQPSYQGKTMLKKKLKRIFLTGLAVVIPAGVTIYILFFIIGVMDSLLRVIPAE